MIMNVTGGENMTLREVTEAADLIRRVAATECDLVFGAVVREDFADDIKITVIAADFKETIEDEQRRKHPLQRKRISPDENLDVPAFLRRNHQAETKSEA